MTGRLSVSLGRPADYAEWRAAALSLLARNVAPEEVVFTGPGANPDLFGGTGDALAERAAADPGTRIHVPRAFPELAGAVLCHRDDTRFGLLYRLLWRLRDAPRLLENAADEDVWQANRMQKSVRRDTHKMKAFVRFRQVGDEAGEAFVAWFEPEHHIVERTAPFFMRRFAGMRWSIVTPEASAHWNLRALKFGPGASRRDCPNDDALEEHWRIYYASIFNPSRLKVNAMRAEMPVKYWHNLPETRLIPALTRSAHSAQRAAPAGSRPSAARARRLVAAQPRHGESPGAVDALQNASAAPSSLEELAAALQTCTRCDLCRHATRAVPGEGPSNARIMLVGEQPGDREDLAGRPFVGPAGKVLDEALEEAGIDRSQAWVTSAVKHFKFTVRGKRRLHQRPNANEIEHCKWWLQHERALVAPSVTVALGATAARALLGRPIAVNRVRGAGLEFPAPAPGAAPHAGIVTVHPSYLLRLPDPGAAREARLQFVADLSRAAAAANQVGV